MRVDERNIYRFAWRASRRRNCLTEMTRTRFRRAILIKSRSRLRSSSLVTKYCALPPIAASTIWSSSGSRHICSSPDVCTTVAPSRDQSNKCLCVPIGIPKPSDQSRSAENFCDLAELWERRDNTELVIRPGGNDSSRRSIRLEEGGNPDVGVKQSDERHGVWP
jgi:hypothetical protein